VRLAFHRHRLGNISLREFARRDVAQFHLIADRGHHENPHLLRQFCPGVAANALVEALK